MRLHIPNATYFITKSTYKRSPIFENMKCAKIFLDTLNYLISKQKTEIAAFVLMKDHYHLLTTLKGSIDISGFLHSLNSYTAHKIAKTIGRSPVWEERTWDEVIRDEAMYYQKMAYILLNPWRKGLVLDPFGHYEYSNLSDILRDCGREFLENLFKKYKRFGE